MRKKQILQCFPIFDGSMKFFWFCDSSFLRSLQISLPAVYFYWKLVTLQTMFISLFMPLLTIIMPNSVFYHCFASCIMHLTFASCHTIDPPSATYSWQHKRRTFIIWKKIILGGSSHNHDWILAMVNSSFWTWGNNKIFL